MTSLNAQLKKLMIFSQLSRSLDYVDMFAELFLSLLFIGVILYWIIIRIQRRRLLPPGPFDFPPIGSLTGINLNSEKDRSRLYKKFGPIVHLTAFGQNIVLVADYDLLNQLFRQSACCQRRIFTESLKLSMFGMPLKQFLMFKPYISAAINHYTFDKNLSLSEYEEQGWSEMLEAMDKCERENSFDLDLIQAFRLVSVNIVWKIISGQVLTEKCHELHEFAEKWKVYLQGVPTYFRYVRGDCVMKYISKQYRISKFKVLTSLGSLNDLIDRKITKALVDGPENSLLRVLIELLDANSSETRKQIVMLAFDLFLGSFESIGNSLMWLLYNLTVNQHYQFQLQKEIDEAVECGAGIESTALPLCHAVIDENHRVGSVAPQGNPHCSSEPVQIAGYTIPQGSVIISDLHSIHHDEMFWRDPEIFRPERFLDDAGNYRRCQRVIPYGVGQLRCIGERWANNFLLITMITLLKRYNIYAVAPDLGLNSSQTGDGFTRSPPPKKYRWTSRID